MPGRLLSLERTQARNTRLYTRSDSHSIGAHQVLGVMWRYRDWSGHHTLHAAGEITASNLTIVRMVVVVS